jgi:UDP-GlcNAc:undecaprenyl-phosphate GlcNAc-1-phosphate transferase
VASAFTALFLSLIVTTGLTPLVRRHAMRAGAVDEPGGRRVHQQVTPRLGGVAVFVGCFAPIAALCIWDTQTASTLFRQIGLLLGFLAGSSIVVLVGAIDDLRGLGPWPKLLAQTAAAVTAYLCGFHIETVNLPWIGDVAMGAFALPVTVFWFLAVTNALNLIDGLDGLASGIALIATGVNCTLAYAHGSTLVLLLASSLGGATLGFLRYNFNPASIFLGDSGSMFLGFALAAMSLADAHTKSSTAVAIMVPLVALGVPVVDTALAMSRRVLARRSIFSADRGHIHHKLLDLGFTHRRVVLTLYTISVLLALSSLGIAFGRSWQLAAASGLAALVLIGLIRTAGRRRLLRLKLQAAEGRETLAALQRRLDGLLHVLERTRSLSNCIACVNEPVPGESRFSLQLGREERSSGVPGELVLAYSAAIDGPQLVLQAFVRPPAELFTAEVRDLLDAVASRCRQASHYDSDLPESPELLVAQ